MDLNTIIASLTSAQGTDETDVAAIEDDVDVLQTDLAAAQVNVAALQAIASNLAAGGLGASAAYSKAATGTNNTLANAVGTRIVLIIVVTTETFADGDGGKTVFTIGEESGSATKFAAAAAIGATAGDVKVFAGTLTSAKKLQTYATAATGTGTGAIAVTVLALPQAA